MREVGEVARPRVLRGLLPTTDFAMLAGLLAATAFLWGRAATMSLWLDEGISVGVASHALRRIPSLLLQDGSPPLYYLLLHGWTSLFGSSDAAAHALSLLFALAVVPAALWAGWSLFGRRTGWMFALAVAVNPYLAYYATEARMYSLSALLALLSTTAFLHAFVFGRRRYLPFFAVCQALLMYTHNWGLLLAVGLAAAVVPCLVVASDRRRVVTDAVLAFGGVLALYLPWLPSLAYQVRQELQPWGRRADLVWIRDDVALLVGGSEAFVALALGAGIGIVAILEGRKRTVAAVAVLALGVMSVVTLAVGWRSSVWAYRYLGVLVGPLLLLAAVGLARGGRIAVAAMTVAAFLAGPIAVKGPPYQKSNARAVADAVSPRLRPGDLVVLPDFQMVPLLAHYLPAGLRYATTSGPVPDADIVDWRNSLERLEENDPAVTLPPLIDSLPVGGHLLLACPPPESDVDSFGLSALDGTQRSGEDRATNTDTGTDTVGTADDGSIRPKATPMPDDVTFHPLILLRCQQTNDIVTNHPDLRLDEVLKAPEGVRYTSVDARLLTKVPAPPGGEG